MRQEENFLNLGDYILIGELDKGLGDVDSGLGSTAFIPGNLTSF